MFSESNSKNRRGYLRMSELWVMTREPVHVYHYSPPPHICFRPPLMTRKNNVTKKMSILTLPRHFSPEPGARRFFATSEKCGSLSVGISTRSSVFRVPILYCWSEVGVDYPRGSQKNNECRDTYKTSSRVFLNSDCLFKKLLFLVEIITAVTGKRKGALGPSRRVEQVILRL